MKLSGDRCQCIGCGEYFNSTYAFDMHRIGDHKVKRECMTPDMMLEKAMTTNEAGYWISKAMPRVK